MPELPEVETLTRQLAPILIGQGLQGVKIFDQKLRGNFSVLAGGRVASVHRSGKSIVFGVAKSKREHFFAVHLRMTGRLIWCAGVKDAPGEKHLRASFICKSGVLKFFDPRRFGTIAFGEPKNTGIDPSKPEFSLKKLETLLLGGRQPLKTWLMRQDRIQGLGNIYACEILHRARLSPFRLGNSLTKEEVIALHRATKKIIETAIKNCGTTFSDFQQSNGQIGKYQQFLQVYGREGEPCSHCREKIQRLQQGGRSTFFCGQCQGK